MASSKRKSNNNRFERNNFDKKVDQFLEVGKQFVDGVSGTRPGTRKKSSFSELSSRNVRNVGNWVSDKIDFLFEDDDADWEDDSLGRTNQGFKSSSMEREYQDDCGSKKKRPLESISLRLNYSIRKDQKRLGPSEEMQSEESSWADDSFYQINKWQRSSNEIKEINSNRQSNQKRGSKTRNFPRSRRSRA
tara:strand:+ start:666 stop:1235 length:570 start_codon:yes stop_codon:yes gene_type:complete